MTGQPLGPFETEQDARDSLVHLLAAATLSEQAGAASRNHRAVRQALATAGVELGGYDRVIAGWLAGWEPAVVAVIAGWVGRAYQSGLAAAGPQLPPADAPVIAVLRAAADALAVDLAVWEARDPAAPSPEARQARRSAAAAADVVITSVSRLRDQLEEGGPR